jgi:hypothetical protein
MAEQDTIVIPAYPSAAPTAEEMAAFDGLTPAQQHAGLQRAIQDGRESGVVSRAMSDILRDLERKYAADGAL